MLAWNSWYDLLTSPSGSLAYNLVLAFALAGSLQMALLQWRATQYPQGARLVRGLAVMLGVRLGLFFVQGLAWQGLVPPSWLPPLDRLANVTGLLILLWLWAFPEPSPRADAATVLGGLALATFAGLTWGMTATVEISTFNGSLFDRLWSALGLLMALGGILILALRRPNHGLFGGVTLAALGIGHLAHLLFPEPGAALSVALRLSELAAYPFLFALLTRYPMPGAPRAVMVTAAPPFTTQVEPQAAEEQPLPSPPPQPAPQRQALQSLLQALVSPTPEDRSLRLVQAAAQYLVADICLMTTPPYTSGQMDVVSGYDLIREQVIPERSLHADDMPLIAAAIEKGKTLRLPASSTSEDLRTLARWLGLEATGPLLVVPLRANGENPPPLGALVFLSPYAQHSWTHEEVQRAEDFARAAAQLILSPLPGHSPLTADLEAEAETLRERLKEAEDQLAASEAQRKMLAERLESAQDHIENLAALLDELENLRGRLKLLEEENRDLKAQLFGLAPTSEEPAQEIQEETAEAAPTEEEETIPRVGPTYEEEIEQLQQSLRLALQEVAALKSELALRDQQLLEWERQGGSPIKQTMIYQSLHTLAQDVRQHLSTVIGYTDLLLSESAGLLGQLQREFLERIRHAAHKIIEIVEDAVRLAAMDLGMEPLEAEPVSLADILDAVVAANSEVLREKRLALRVDLPDTLPALQLNRDALHQIVHNLLRNAALASPPEGDILLRVENQTLPEGRYVLLMVKDSGPGIAPEDLPRVFSRIYRTGYRLIEGLGDNGIGLPLVKTLVEALGGRIWVESEKGQGAAFHVLLPTEPPAEDATPPGAESLSGKEQA